MLREGHTSLPIVTPSPHTDSTVSEFRSHGRITVQSLCCEADEVHPMFTTPAEDHHAWGSKGFATPDAVPTRVAYHQSERPGVMDNGRSSEPGHSRPRSALGLANHHCHVGRLDAMAAQSRAFDTIDTTAIEIRPGRNTDDAFIIDRSQSLVVPQMSGLFTNSGSSSSKVVSKFHETDEQLKPTSPSNKPFRHISRPGRLSYTEKQKFFIMYHRIVRGLSWPDIEERFASFFPLRTKDGLTSVYYRVRKEWGMKDVLKNNFSTTDESAVKERAIHFQKEFLDRLGYDD